MGAAEIRGLTLRRPWAAAFLLPSSGSIRPKRVENRSWWPRSYTEPMVEGIAGARSDRPLWLALHSGSGVDRDGERWLAEQGVSVGPPPPGGVVAVCRLARVYDVDALQEAGADRLLDRFAPWVAGPYAWEVDDVRPLSGLVVPRGALSLWRLPPEVDAAVAEVVRG